MQKRFDIIKQSIAEVAGPRAANGAAATAWLQALEHAVRYAMVGLRQNPQSDIESYMAEVHYITTSIQGDLCNMLGADALESMSLARSFHEILREIDEG